MPSTVISVYVAMIRRASTIAQRASVCTQCFQLCWNQHHQLAWKRANTATVEAPHAEGRPRLCPRLLSNTTMLLISLTASAKQQHNHANCSLTRSGSDLQHEECGGTHAGDSILHCDVQVPKPWEAASCIPLQLGCWRVVEGLHNDIGPADRLVGGDS